MLYIRVCMHSQMVNTVQWGPVEEDMTMTQLRELKNYDQNVEGYVETERQRL